VTSRRAVLGTAAGVVLATAGCAGGERPTQVAVVWSGQELANFRRVLRGYPHPVEVVSAGDDIDAFLGARHRAGNSPDVAILPRPGLVTQYARRGWLSPLDESVADAYPLKWSAWLRVGGRLYAAWIKAAYKSLIWYQPSIVDSPPQTWDELLALVRELGAKGPAPLAIGAADGWVLSDWFENVLAGQEPAFYDDLASGTASWQDAKVGTALSLLAELWSVPGAFVGGPRRALLTQWEESVIQVTDRRAAMVFEADFVETVAANVHQPGTPPLAWVRFPRLPEGGRPIVVGGDAAVVLRGSARGQQLVSWLTGPSVFASWIRAGGYLSLNDGVPAASYPEPMQQELVDEMQKRKQDVQFDLSDRLTAPFGGADGVGIWKILQDFFQAVTAPGADRPAAVAATLAALDRAARDNGSAR
jgi:ABC-type glycerol-3-phosphate transport system substrate-binding protein